MFELTIRELTPYTEEEIRELDKRRGDFMGRITPELYSDKPHHEVRVMNVRVDQKEFNAIKKAVLEVI